MAWQDFVFIAGSFAQVPTLVPMMLAPVKPPLRTSLPLVVILSVFGVAFVTLQLWLSAVGMFSVVACWLVLLGQRLRTLTPS